MIYIVTGSHSANGKPFTTIELVTKDAGEAHEMANDLREEEKSSVELADEDYEPSTYTVHEQEC
ncbi:MAG: hypothetical protein ACRC3Z_12370 [Phocaeicola sp.]